MWRPPQWHRARPDGGPRGTHTPDGSCGHTANNALKMNSAGVSSLYIPGIVIIRLLIHRKHILHVRHVEKTIRNSGRESGPLHGPASLVRTALPFCFKPSLYICTQHGSHMLDGVIRMLGGTVPIWRTCADSGGNTRTTVGAAHFCLRNAHTQWCNASIQRHAHPGGVAHTSGSAAPTRRGAAHTSWRSVEHSHAPRHVCSPPKYCA